MVSQARVLCGITGTRRNKLTLSRCRAELAGGASAAAAEKICVGRVAPTLAPLLSLNSGCKLLLQPNKLLNLTKKALECVLLAADEKSALVTLAPGRLRFLSTDRSILEYLGV